MGHVVGLWHEQSREDRDTYVKILWENMQPDLTYNFTQNIYDGDDIGLYDYGSIMHYPTSGFSANGKPTIETIPPGIPIGQRAGLSAGDIAAVKRMYPSSSLSLVSPTSAITFESVPTGQTITIDGVNYRTPKTVQWLPGSVHTVTAVNLPVVNGTRNVFVRWTDGGAQTHTIVTPASENAYRADYATSYSAMITAAAPGSVSVSPVEREHVLHQRHVGCYPGDCAIGLLFYFLDGAGGRNTRTDNSLNAESVHRTGQLPTRQHIHFAVSDYSAGADRIHYAGNQCKRYGRLCLGGDESCKLGQNHFGRVRQWSGGGEADSRSAYEDGSSEDRNPNDCRAACCHNPINQITTAYES